MNPEDPVVQAMMKKCGLQHADMDKNDAHGATNGMDNHHSGSEKNATNGKQHGDHGSH